MTMNHEFLAVNLEYEMLKEGLTRAGNVCLGYWRQGAIASIQKDSIHSVVTEADLKSQSILVDWMRKMYPQTQIMSEESVNANPSADFWTIDPLDGTSHFERGLEGWSISAARVVKGEVLTAVTYAPVANEFFYASRDEGAFVNGRRMRVSTIDNLKDGVINVGHRTVRTDEDGRVRELLKKVRTMWTTGSTTLVLANLAAGRLDISLQEEQSFWDIAAGILLVNEAGGKFTNREGSEEFDISGARTHQNDIVVTNGILHEDILEQFSS